MGEEVNEVTLVFFISECMVKILFGGLESIFTAFGEVIVYPTRSNFWSYGKKVFNLKSCQKQRFSKFNLQWLFHWQNDRKSRKNWKGFPQLIKCEAMMMCNWNQGPNVSILTDYQCTCNSPLHNTFLKSTRSSCSGPLSALEIFVLQTECIQIKKWYSSKPLLWR